MSKYSFWFVVGSQFLYGPEVLEIVEARAKEMAEELSVSVAGIIPRDGLIQLAEEQNTTVLSAFPDSELAATYRTLAKTMYDLAEEVDT